MGKLTELETLVRPYIGGCPSLLVEKHLRTAAREFCAETQAWQETYPATFIAGQNTWFIPTSDEDELVAITSFVDADGFPVRFTATGKMIRLQNTPTSTQNCELTLALKPSLTTIEFDDDLMSRWGNVIADGATRTILLEPGRKWSNPDLAKYFNSMFDLGKGDARLSVITNSSNADQTVKMRPFA